MTTINSKHKNWLNWLIISVCVLIIFIFALSFLLNSLIPDSKVFPAKIAVIPVKGDIYFDKAMFSDALTADELIERIESAEHDPSINAILLEINSSGGEVVATKQVVEKLKQTKKPVVSWIASVGASGAYYIAATSDYIFADADSITGSIGVISMIMNYEGLMEKLGLEVEVLKEGEFKDMLSPFSDFDDKGKALLQEMIHESYLGFKNDVFELRNGKMNETAFDEIADGRILSGRQALKIGLIDELGTKEDALMKASELAGFSGKPIAINYANSGSGLGSFFTTAGFSFGQGFKEGLEYTPTYIRT
ncbi:MAG: signal peptide peptidase SppA [Candidatus Diapherotrites archaeon]